MLGDFDLGEQVWSEIKLFFWKVILVGSNREITVKINGNLRVFGHFVVPRVG